MNPFSDEYCRKEIEKLSCPESSFGDVVIKKYDIEGRCDDFLTVNYRSGDRVIKDCPLFTKKGKIWMSLTPMEIQSSYLPIRHGRSSERVATVGLGIGYFTVRVMSSPKVKTLDVYEIDPHVVELFKLNFSKRKGFKKINFIIGDFRETLKGKNYDFCYVDPYQDMLPDEIITDYVNLHSENKIKLLRPWAVELCFVDIDGPPDIMRFLERNDSRLRGVHINQDFCEDVTSTIMGYESY